MLYQNFPADIRMLCRYLGCKLFMDSLSLAGIAVQNEEENVISDKIVIPILVILTLSKGRTVGDIEVFIEILAAGVTVFFQRVIIGYVMVSHYWSQRDSVERKMLQIESIMLFTSEISHLIPQMEEKMKAMVDEKAAELTKKFEQTAGTGSSSAAVFSVVTLSKGQTLVGDVGCEVMLRIGSATCVSDGSTGLIDTTSGGNLGNGKALEKNHLYMVTISTRSVSAGSETVKLLVRGPYTIQ